MNTETQTFPILQTERLTLRQLSTDDASEILQLRSDGEVNKFLDRKPSKTLEDALSFIDIILKNDEGYYWAITKTDDNKLIGTLCLFDFSVDQKKCEIGYELGTAYQRQGIMTEAVRKVIQYAFKTLGIKTIDAFTHAENQSSTKLLQKLNFTDLGSTENRNLILFRLIN